MTRINSAIPVQRLTDEHLLAEHREIKRLPYCLERAVRSGSIGRVPQTFTLGKGHVMFFLNKCRFTHQRYMTIHEELLARGFNCEFYGDNWLQTKDGHDGASFYNDYEPTEAEHDLLVQRITQRIMESPKPVWHYYGRQLTKQEAAGLLTGDGADKMKKGFRTGLTFVTHKS